MTERALAVLGQDPEVLSEWRRFVGSTIVGVDLGEGDRVGELCVSFEVALPDGTREVVPGGPFSEVSEAGVCGFELERCYGRDDLRRMIEAAIGDDAVAEDVRAGLREELSELDLYHTQTEAGGR